MPKPLKKSAKEHTVIMEQKKSSEKIHPEERDVTEVLEQSWIEKGDTKSPWRRPRP